ncbi:uncharacterized protein LOC128553347 [Mercenaria mercenaria]|uniref:uncharacterized protein LOC128553347 n=1 Tax=Mercenaria mercenaria TaxID=6596 RepID=UPI00234F626B|nr:uncharacterized protein LOC128553347 [Mercenaria mercenaria]
MKIIKGFEFIFLILLWHHLDKPTIKMMLEGQFGHPVLQKILDTESDKCLIVLDGLDEWISKSLSHLQIETKGLPVGDKAKDYTVVTTSKPWTIELLGMKKNEIQKVMLRGIDKNATKTLVKKTIKLLNATFEQKRSSETFIKYLKTSPFSDIQHLPVLLQQLICLWYENNDLTSSSRCTLYRSMLELSFKWSDRKKRRNYVSDLGSKTKTFPSLQIPHALNPARMYTDYQNTINSASKLAFEVLFKQQKVNTISFDIQTCKRLQIPVDVLKVCVNIGILYEDKIVCFTAVGQNESSFCFVHKSIQEFLAAIHIADIFKTCSLTESEREKTMSSHPMTEQEYTTTLRQLSELDDTTYFRHVSKDISPRHLVLELDDIKNQHPHLERGDITSSQSCSLSENITSQHTSSGKDIMSPQTVSEREHITSPHSSSQTEDVRYPNIGAVPEIMPSPHQSSQKVDMTPSCTYSERDDTTSLYHRLEREDMSEREYAGWPDVYEDFIQRICARIETIENILEVADVFVFLSGLKPRLTTYISKYIYNIVDQSRLVVKHGNTLDECTYLYEIQKCISGCCDEANSHAIFAKCAVYLRDCFLNDSESAMPSLTSSTAQNIIPDSIESLSVSFSRECPLFRGRSTCDICRVLTHFLSLCGLTKLALKDKRTKIDDGHIRLIKKILETNTQSLRTVSVSYSFGGKSYLKGMELESFEPLITSFPKLNQLTALKLQIINLPHEQCNFFESYLADTVRLQELSLDIECEGKDDHEIDMATHATLQYLEIGDSFTVRNVNTKHCMTVKYKIKRSNDSSINRLFRFLESVNLKYVSLRGNRDGDSASAAFTHKLCSLLVKSPYLRAIELDSLEITDNILTLPYRLASLKRIDLSEVTMTLRA